MRSADVYPLTPRFAIRSSGVAVAARDRISWFGNRSAADRTAVPIV